MHSWNINEAPGGNVNPCNKCNTVQQVVPLAQLFSMSKYGPTDICQRDTIVLMCGWELILGLK